MPLLKKDPAKEEQKAREAKERAERQAREAAERARAQAEAAFSATPRGRARTAREAGQRLFQITLPLSVTERTPMAVLSGDKNMATTKTEHYDTLSEIEIEGWRLEHVGYVFQETGSVSRDKLLSSGQTVAVTGMIVGIYLFRAAERRSSPA